MMKWKTKPQPEPKHNDKRIVKRFLLFPKRLDLEYRWLEWAYIEQHYDAYDFVHMSSWRTQHWAKNSVTLHNG